MRLIPTGAGRASKAGFRGRIARGTGLALALLMLVPESPAAGQSLSELLKARLTRAQGETQAPEDAIVGQSGLYTLQPILGEWVKVGRDHFFEGTDLSLYGSSVRTSVLVWVDCDGESIDERVRFRREDMRDTLDDLTIEERRVLMAGSLVPVSYTRYEGTWNDQDSIILVATAAQGEVLVEVIADTTDGAEGVTEVQAIVGSFELKKEATSCEDS